MIIPKSIGLVIRPDKLEDTDDAYRKAKAAGIVIQRTADSAREQASVDKGYVVVVGPDAFKAFGDNPWCKVGDYVAYARFAGKYVEDVESGEELLIVNDEDICAVLIQAP